MNFQWDEAKRLRNVEVHNLDFVRAAELFEGDLLRTRSDRGDETRYVVTGRLDAFRRARRKERRDCFSLYGG